MMNWICETTGLTPIAVLISIGVIVAIILSFMIEAGEQKVEDAAKSIETD